MTDKLVHRDKSREYLAQAFAELAAGDDMQAAEKGWGAASQMIKAVAEQRGWENSAHYQLTNAVTRMVQETGDEEMGSIYTTANSLHIHFYEGWLSPGMVERAIQDVTRFVDKVEALLDGQAKPATSR